MAIWAVLKMLLLRTVVLFPVSDDSNKATGIIYWNGIVGYGEANLGTISKVEKCGK
jgi:hypothetical protein